jgi:serine/threonine-protein kinase
MEYVDGADLKAIIEYKTKTGERVPIEATCFVCEKICDGLSYAQQVTNSRGERLGIVHRDMSPPNVLLTRFGEVKVVDFGLAKANSQLEKSEPGIIKGKFSYLSPEAAHGEDVDARADIFAVGIMLWEMLAGRRLFLGESDLQTVRMIQQARVPSLREFNPQVTPELESVVRRALARDRNQRYQTARELGKDLNRILYGLGRPISTFDLGMLVEEVVSERRRAKGASRSGQHSLIGSLISDAMMEFTSIKNDSGPEQGGSGGGRTPLELGSSPLNIGSFNGVQDWSSDLHLDAAAAEAQAGHGPSLPAGYSAGNLAALEEDAPGRPLAQHASPGYDADEDIPQKSGGGAGVAVFWTVLLAAAGAVGAYFAGIIP